MAGKSRGTYPSLLDGIGMSKIRGFEVVTMLSELRELWLELGEVQLVLEAQDLAAQDRTPRMNHVLGSIVQRLGELLDPLEGSIP